MSSCEWPGNNPLMQKYHDEEWGVPVFDDLKLFEFITLDAFQAGLSWSAILNKRENFRKAFDNFNPIKIAKYSDKKFEELMKNPGIIRNRMKINATINNARQFLFIQKEFGSFSNYFWSLIDFEPVINKWKAMGEIPPRTELSDSISKELVNRGFKFVGSTICYSFMQAAGMINDHVKGCSRYNQINEMHQKNSLLKRTE